MTQNVYFFGNGHADGSAGMRQLLGGKGAGLHEMTNLGVPVPPGFTLTTTLCAPYLTSNTFPPTLRNEVDAAIRKLEAVTRKELGGHEHPLLVSVRSGAPVSMPGMMETILNLGLNDETVCGLERSTGNPNFAWDAYRRFVGMYGSVVFDVPKALFDAPLEKRKRARRVERDIDLTADDLRSLVADYKALIEDASRRPFPDDPMTQLWGAIEAVYQSWQTPRAEQYRRVHRLDDAIGTAVNVVAMVFGNMGESSATGVAFTRDPSTGEKHLYGEYLINAQGEDVVAGIRTPRPLEQMAGDLPGAYGQLVDLGERLERHYGDAQDIEFTVEANHLYLLQSRRAQRTGHASVRIAVDMVAEGILNEGQALLRVPAEALDQLLHPSVDPQCEVDLLATGLPASPGAAVGRVVFEADAAASAADRGDPVILVRQETSPDDFHGMVAAQAVVTARGGMTSHAAVVARGMGKTCVAGAAELDVDYAARECRANGRVVREGDWITADGSTGRVILGQASLVSGDPGPEFNTLMQWADAVRRLRVRVNADTPVDARRGRDFGAEGIGLCRTEHMFFGDERVTAMREMIVAKGVDARRTALAKLLPMQRDDFVGIFEAMDGLPVTIRLLDPPLHEFLPHDSADVAALADTLGVPMADMQHTVDRLRESNPMLGHRGCRLGVSYPEITEMQCQALFEAACEAANRGTSVMPEVMVPLVAEVAEFRHQADIVRRVAADVFKNTGTSIPYLVGTMIELPRAAITADKISPETDFFSFGTNDLTQMTYGLSRDDAGTFLAYYVEMGILETDPFQVLDPDGVGYLVRLGTERGRRARPDLKVGICGEHGGDPASVMFCHDAGLDYVSCSAFRVPIARLAAAQATLREREAKPGEA